MSGLQDPSSEANALGLCADARLHNTAVISYVRTSLQI